MSLEEELGWSVRDNHCSTLKQYIISAFTPKGRLRRRDFLITLLVIFAVMFILSFIPAAYNAQCQMEFAEVYYHDATFFGTFWELTFSLAAEYVFLNMIYLIILPMFSLIPCLLPFCIIVCPKPAEDPQILFEILLLWFVLDLIAAYFILCCTIRRLHDSGYSGWNLLLVCIPIASLFLFYPLLTADVGYQNKYGSDPRLPYEGQYTD